MQKGIIRKGFVIGIIVLLIGVSILPSISGDIGTLKVKKSRESIIFPLNRGTLYVGGDGPGNYSSIQSAVNYANDGDTIFVYDDSSPYYGMLTVNKSINLIGEDKNTTIIDGEGNLDVIIIKANNVVIEGFSITDGVFSGILICNQDCIITDNIFTSNENFCIFLFHWNCNNNKIIGNYISNNENGIHIFGSNNIITKNIIINNDGSGIALGKPSNNNFISYNRIISNNGSAIVLGWSYNNTIFKNIVSSNDDNSIFLYKSRNNTIIYNNITWKYC